MSSTINKTELISKLQTLKGLTNEERSNLIGLLRQKKYGLVWEDKPEDVEERLRDVKGKYIPSDASELLSVVIDDNTKFYKLCQIR